MSVIAIEEQPISDVIADLRRHESYHRMGFDCSCGETDEDGRPLPDLNAEREAVIKRLEEMIADVRQIGQHRCHFEMHDSQEYYYPCPVCGADGNV